MSSKFNLTKLILTQANRYQPQYRHPLEFVATPETMAALSAQVPLDTQIASQSLTSVTNDCITQGVEEDAVKLPNGWNADRFTFTLELEAVSPTGFVVQYILTGYTDRLGVVTIDENKIRPDYHMRFFINSITHLTDSRENTPTGTRRFRHNRGTQLLYADINMGNFREGVFLLTPENLFAAIQRNRLMEMSDLPIYDTRTAIGQMKASDTDDLISSNYLARIINAYRAAYLSQSMYMNENDLLATARGYVSERRVTMHPFLKDISRLRDYAQPTIDFTYEELLRVTNGNDNDIIINLRDQIDEMPLGDAVQPHGIARSLSYAIACLVYSTMMKNSLTTLHLTYEDPGNSMGCVVHDYSTFDGIEGWQMAVNFKHAFDHEMKHGIQIDGQLPMSVRIQADFAHHIQMDFTNLGGEIHDPLTIVIPTFCFAQFSPLLSKQPQLLNQSAQALENLLMNLPFNIDLNAINSQPPQ